MNDPKTLIQMGNADLARGAFAQAESLFERAVALDARAHPAWSALANIRVQRGDRAGALDAALKAAELRPDHWPYRLQAGQALVLNNRLEDGLGHMEAARDAAPTNYFVLESLGMAYVQAFRADDAHRTFARAIEHLPDDAQTCQMLGEYLQSALLDDLADRCLEKWASLAPDEPTRLVRRAGTLFDQRRYEECAKLLEDGLRRHPNDARLRGRRAWLFERQHKYDLAKEEAERALAINPDLAGPRVTLAKMIRRAGDLERARAELERAARNSPGDPASETTAFTELGMVLDELGEYPRAFEAFSHAQRAWLGRPSVQAISRDMLPQRIEAGRSIDWTGVVPQWSAEHRSQRPAPVFFMGFPRSGTTLVERMLGSHPAFLATDELPLATRLSIAAGRMTGDRRDLRGLGRLTPDQLRTLEEGYWTDADRHVPGLAASGRVLVDKMPMNMVALPFIRRVFPDAKILMALRDPRDCILSNFMQEYRPNEAMVHMASLESAAAIYASVMDLWIHLRDTMDLDFLEYRYEDLTADTETVARRILEFLGQPWDPEVLSFHKKASTEVVRTPSYQAVTKPVNRKAVGRWRRYAPQLEPVLPTIRRFVDLWGEPGA